MQLRQVAWSLREYMQASTRCESNSVILVSFSLIEIFSGTRPGVPPAQRVGCVVLAAARCGRRAPLQPGLLTLEFRADTKQAERSCGITSQRFSKMSALSRR